MGFNQHTFINYPGLTPVFCVRCAGITVVERYRAIELWARLIESESEVEVSMRWNCSVAFTQAFAFQPNLPGVPFARVQSIRALSRL